MEGAHHWNSALSRVLELLIKVVKTAAAAAAAVVVVVAAVLCAAEVARTVSHVVVEWVQL